jgi:hypothetical protein
VSGASPALHRNSVDFVRADLCPDFLNHVTHTIAVLPRDVAELLVEDVENLLQKSMMFTLFCIARQRSIRNSGVKGCCTPLWRPCLPLQYNFDLR